MVDTGARDKVYLATKATGLLRDLDGVWQADAIGTYSSFVSDGRVGSYGWSNVATWRLAQIRATAAAHGWAQPVAVQQQHSYLRPRAGLRNNSIVSAEQIDFLNTYPDLQLIAYTPLLKGLYSVTARREDFWAMAPYAGPDAHARLAAVDQVAATVGATGNQVVLAWMLASKQVRTLPLIGPRTFHQYLECVGALDISLTPEHVEMLDQAGES